MIIIDSKRKKREMILKKYPSSLLMDVYFSTFTYYKDGRSMMGDEFRQR